MPERTKVVVIGAAGAGKSSLLQALSGAPGLPGRSLVHGRAAWGRGGVDLLGLQASAALDPLLPALVRNARAVLLVVDSTDPASFPRASALARACGAEARLLIIANKQDRPEAMSTVHVAERLGLRPQIRAVPCSTQDLGSCAGVLDSVLRAPTPSP